MKLKIHVVSYSLLTIACTVSGIGTAYAQCAGTNTCYGSYALNSNTSGEFDSAFGVGALQHNTTGSYNTAVGFYALYLNASGNYNVASGESALYSNTTGSQNTASGESALYQNTSGNQNTATGLSALQENTTGSYNTATGVSALLGNTTGCCNTASGWQALFWNGGSYNNAVGYNALYKNKAGTKNIAVGGSALYNNTTGNYNEAMGSQALYGNTTGSNNIGIGYQAAYYPNAGSNNIEIGSSGAAADNAVIRIGTQGTQKKTYLAGVRGVNVTGGVAVMVTASGQLGVVSSSRRYKEDIRSMGDTSERLLRLRPVTFRYKKPDESGQKPEQYGLIAEEVAKVMPELVIYNDKGQPETVAYQALAPLLLNELQKEHRRAEQQASDFRRQLASVTAQLAELRQTTAQLSAKR